MSKERVAELLGEDDWAEALAEDADVTQMALHFGEYKWAISEVDGVLTDGEGGLDISFPGDRSPMTEKPLISKYAADGKRGTWCIITAAVYFF
jgi:hypothetical protein